jgi:hypothetical protein
MVAISAFGEAAVLGSTSALVLYIAAVGTQILAYFCQSAK